MLDNILTSLLQNVGYYIKSPLEPGNSGKLSTQVTFSNTKGYGDV